MPKTTYVLVEYLMQQRRSIRTVARLPRTPSRPSWLFDRDLARYRRDGRFDELRSRHATSKAPRVDPTGFLHKDTKTIVQERFFIDKENPDVLHDEITTMITR